MADVRSGTIYPVLDDFRSFDGTPLYVNRTTGRGYVLDATDTIVPIVAESLPGMPLNVIDYGADPTGNSDDTTAIQDAFDVAIAARVGTVLFPAGVYNHTGLTLAPASSQIHVNLLGLGGVGAFGVNLNYTGTGGTGLTIANNTRYSVKNLRLTDGGTGAMGLALTSLAVGSNHGPAYFENNVISGFTTNLQIGDTSNFAASELTFLQMEVENCTNGILIEGSASGAIYSTNIRFFSLGAVSCGTVLKTSGDNTDNTMNLSIYGGSFANNTLECDFGIPGTYRLNDIRSENSGAGQFIKSGSATATANSATSTIVTLDNVLTSYPSSPANFVALFYQPGQYTVRNSNLSTGSIQLGGFDGGAGPRKSTLTVDTSIIVSGSPAIAYKASSNTIWQVRHFNGGTTANEAVNTFEDRHYVIDTTGAESIIAKYGAWSASAGGDALLAGLGLRIVATASLPAASTDMNGTVLIEDAGAGDRNLIIYAGGQRFRIDGGANV